MPLSSSPIPPHPITHTPKALWPQTAYSRSCADSSNHTPAMHSPWLFRAPQPPHPTLFDSTQGSSSNSKDYYYYSSDPDVSFISWVLRFYFTTSLIGENWDFTDYSISHVIKFAWLLFSGLHWLVLYYHSFFPLTAFRRHKSLWLLFFKSIFWWWCLYFVDTPFLNGFIIEAIFQFYLNENYDYINIHVIGNQSKRKDITVIFIRRTVVFKNKINKN